MVATCRKPSICHGLHYEGVYQLEDGVPAAIRRGLKKLGHKTTSVVGPLGAPGDLDRLGQGTLTGGSDPRKDVVRWLLSPIAHEA